MSKPDLVGADHRGVVDRHNEVERVEGSGPHDDPHAAVVDHLAIVQLDEGVGVPDGFNSLVKYD